MSDRSGATSRDFAFQTSDQAGGASQQHPQQFYGGYHAEHNTALAEATSQAHNDDFSLGFHNSTGNAQHHQLMPGHFPGLGFNPSVPSAWETIDFSDFTNQYEPQGELVQEYQGQVNPIGDFSIPHSVAAGEAAYQAFTQSQSATTTPNAAQSQSQLSPPPPHPPPPAQPQQQQRPTTQVGMKRKVDSESTSTVPQSGGLGTENPPKRQNVSRHSSDASAASPVLPASADARTPSMARTAAQTSTEAVPQPASRENTNTERRKEQSKGTGPQGRVIDVSTPRRVSESPGGLDILPAGKVFPIQIGSELFRLSGASIASDEHPRTFHISSASNCITTAVELAT
jgi:hypothetical protein